jgi:hypothetical protein
MRAQASSAYLALARAVPTTGDLSSFRTAPRDRARGNEVSRRAGYSEGEVANRLFGLAGPQLTTHHYPLGMAKRSQAAIHAGDRAQLHGNSDVHAGASIRRG